MRNTSPIQTAVRPGGPIFFILVFANICNPIEVLAGGQIRGEERGVLVPFIVQQSIVGPGWAIHGVKALLTFLETEFLGFQEYSHTRRGSQQQFLATNPQAASIPLSWREVGSGPSRLAAGPQVPP